MAGRAPETPVCGEPLEGAAVTGLITTRAGVACVQARDRVALREVARAEAARTGRPVAVDEVLAVAPMRSLPLSILDGLLVRPALDGVCAGRRCLAPWQLVADDAFVSSQPLAAVPDLRFGANGAALAARLGAAPDTRIATRATLVAADGSETTLDRGRPVEAATLAAATAAAQRYVLDAQQPDGRFAYLVNPYSGATSMRGWGVPRQAGPTLALCELGDAGPRVAEAARRSLALLAAGDADGVRRLGPPALVLAALVTCRPRVGPAFDGEIATLARGILAMARPDGSFHHRFDATHGAPIAAPDDLYAAGQAVLALVLVERLAAEERIEGLPPAPELREAIDRAMRYTASDYWPSFLRSFFFLEENWHCLAARAALARHRVDGYERFCLDYVASRRRWLLGDEVAPAHRGGLGFGNVVPPQSTPTAGHGEALAAAIALRRARGEDASAEQADLRRVLAFLLRQQWRGPECVACAAPEKVVGGFSESVASPSIRIDYVQHAWAALAHGAEVLPVE